MVGNVIRKYYDLVKKSDFDIPKKNILDLRYIFLKNQDTFYTDKCCHLNPKGMNLLADSISKNILSILEDNQTNPYSSR